MQEVHAFQANGALPRGLALSACRLRFTLSRTEMRGDLLLGQAVVASTYPGCALLRPAHVLWRRRPEVIHRFFGLEEGQKLPRLPGDDAKG